MKKFTYSVVVEVSDDLPHEQQARIIGTRIADALESWVNSSEEGLCPNTKDGCYTERITVSHNGTVCADYKIV